jgi:hypothetical protein
VLALKNGSTVATKFPVLALKNGFTVATKFPVLALKNGFTVATKLSVLALITGYAVANKQIYALSRAEFHNRSFQSLISQTFSEKEKNKT